MATVIEGALWTLTEKAAEHLASKGFIFKCDAEHAQTLPVDQPIYHIHHQAPPEVGFTTMAGIIAEAEKEVESNA